MCTRRLETPALKIVCSSSHMSPETREFVELFKEPQFANVSGSLVLPAYILPLYISHHQALNPLPGFSNRHIAVSAHGQGCFSCVIANRVLQRTVQVGSSLKLVMVAEGKAHIYPR